jgi:ferric-dicitrate binding protein FerR (iron transport regulator)
VALRRRRTLAVGAAAGIAAAVLLAVGLVPDRGRNSDIPPVITAMLTSATGTVQRAPRAATEPVWLRNGDGVTGNDRIRTPGSVVAAFTMANGASLRVNERTSVLIESPSVVTVEQGAVYIDTEGASAGAAFEVRTALGVIRDIGTQFEVDVTELRTRVRVRDGEVVLTRNSVETRAGRGTQLVAATDAVTSSSVPVFGAEWEWVGRLPSPFNLNAHTLMEFLTWVSRETGYAVAFESEDLAEKARRMTVQGSVDGLTPHEALETVLPATGLEYGLSNGRVTIRTR